MQIYDGISQRKNIYNQENGHPFAWDKKITQQISLQYFIKQNPPVPNNYLLLEEPLKDISSEFTCRYFLSSNLRIYSPGDMPFTFLK